MKKLIRALSVLIKNIHIHCTSKCCDCDSDCNKPVTEVIDDIADDIIEIKEKLDTVKISSI